PLFTPPVVSQIIGPLATLMGAFATNWPGGSYDPETHILYVYSQSGVIPLGLVKPTDPKIDLNYVQGSATAGMRTNPGTGGAAGGSAPRAARAEAAPPPPGGGGGGGEINARGLPLIKPPYGRITAIDLNKGEFAWQVAHGETPDNVKNHPALKGLNIPRTGQA